MWEKTLKFPVGCFIMIKCMFYDTVWKQDAVCMWHQKNRDNRD